MSNTLTVKLTTKGQVTIPQQLRKRFGLSPGIEVVFDSTDEGVLIRPAHDREREIEERLARATGSATVPITTNEIMRLTRSED